MIELNKKTQQDFLNREWVQRLLDAGVDMSDAKYIIGKLNWTKLDNHDWIAEKQIDPDELYDILPTYTVSELLYKLHEWIYPTIDGVEYSGGLKFLKDAPFYIWYYELKGSIVDSKTNYKSELNKEDYIYAEFEYPIESLASLLIQCHKKDIGIKAKDTGDISDK